MLIEVRCPCLTEIAGAMEVVAVHAGPGVALEPGGALLDFRLDLSAGVAHDCPPVSTYRIALAEPGTVTRLQAHEGDAIAAGDLLAQLEARGNGSPRSARVTVVAILHFDDWWSEA